MTEKLRYVGPTTVEYQDGKVYPLLMTVHRGFLELNKPGNYPMKYASLAMLLQYLLPTSMPYTSAKDNEVNEGRVDGFARKC